MPHEKIRALASKAIAVSFIHNGFPVAVSATLKLTDGPTEAHQPFVMAECEIPLQGGGTVKYAIPLTGGHLNRIVDDNTKGRPLTHVFEGLFVPMPTDESPVT